MDTRRCGRLRRGYAREKAMLIGWPHISTREGGRGCAAWCFWLVLLGHVEKVGARPGAKGERRERGRGRREAAASALAQAEAEQVGLWGAAWRWAYLGARPSAGAEKGKKKGARPGKNEERGERREDGPGEKKAGRLGQAGGKKLGQAKRE